MPTDIARGRTDAVKFALLAVASSLGLFGLLRLSWIEAHVVLPATRAQAVVAVGLFGTPALPVEVTLACSGADALGLCLGAILAYPVRWRTRLAAAAGGTALVLGLNTLRIATLGLVAASPGWFNTLHVYVWPSVLTLAIAGYVFAWMRLADGRSQQDERVAAHPQTTSDERPRDWFPVKRPKPTRLFVVLTGAFLVLFVASSPLYLQSAGVLAIAGFVARAAAAILAGVGVSAHVADNVLWTPRGGFLVTQECISTPLIPVYLAAIFTYSTTRWRLILGVLAMLPLFIVLGIVRLLVVALPAAVAASPFFLVHAFYQLLLGVVVVFLAALWRHGGRAALAQALIGVIAGVLFVGLVGPSYTRLITSSAGPPLDDPQGAIALLPAFQVGLYLALWVAAFVAIGWWRFLAGLTLLGLTQSAGLLLLHAVAGYSGATAHVRDIRGWAVAGPVLIVAAVINFAPPRR